MSSLAEKHRSFLDLYGLAPAMELKSDVSVDTLPIASISDTYVDDKFKELVSTFDLTPTVEPEIVTEPEVEPTAPTPVTLTTYEPYAPQASSLRERAAKVGRVLGSWVLLPLVAMGVGYGVIKGYDSYEAGKRTFEVPSYDNEIEAPVAGVVSVEVESPTSLALPIAREEALPTVTTAAEAITTTTTEAPITTSTTTPEVAPAAPESLTQRLLNGETTMSVERGQKLGLLRLDKFCDDVQLFVNNQVNYKDPRTWPVLSIEALDDMDKIENDPTLSPEEKRRLQFDIYSKGFINKSGDPLYLEEADNTPEDGCVPTAENPRAKQDLYGSTALDARIGEYAIILQPTGTVSEHGGLPGQGKVTHISMHRSSESAAGNGMDEFSFGDTVTYLVDATASKYVMFQKRVVSSKRKLPDVIAEIQHDYEGIDVLAIQVCQPGDEDYMTYIMVKVQE